MPKTRSVSAVMERARDVAGKRWKAPDARAALRAHAASGLSLAAFARRDGLSLTRLMWWRKRLRGESSTSAPGVRWLPVTIRRSSPVPLPVAPHVEIAVRGGRVIHVAGPFDPRAVAELVRALEELAC